MARTASSAPLALRGMWRLPGEWVSAGPGRGLRASAGTGVRVPVPQRLPLFSQRFFEVPLAVPRVGARLPSHSLLGPQDGEAAVSVGHTKNSVKMGNRQKTIRGFKHFKSRVVIWGCPFMALKPSTVRMDRDSLCRSDIGRLGCLWACVCLWSTLEQR